ncbi:PaaI family thioesterase [Verminephrobacter aporrectodeae]|uniref:PaaI family thioesterase n=1 Tax=Verminephrobacter aporrectodeae subsp. tuberculatae TaxID=1110392 RepID=A0ABT3KXL6_9BURK|nr:PaaI family thioesterase [Verminephrobacter aporrectodeae]MCW5221561.1 PaaI family thioesterase [Verminephrobacter aporrectodeae subsp. tuberculatae]MCW5257874.1 PaaI family thioesterase [Verminephrobacter aporrectodeae subsp. tuberculatae]MCW5290852.1 PaaI family thioesterase [Verminephrobacter aporrectodeae subsp. tuberculatae]MCW5322991.1 PaaI family thioesterase [Verminephrobacter aporrectodeae subsp. tuberculatae]MCW8164979.1 PaaI family thioesterase [Verminephrobacter aporrectodeae su
MLPFGVDIPFVHHLGIVVHRMEGGVSELGYEARPEHLNTLGVTHGGASMTLLDVAMAIAARSVTPDMGVVTVEMKTSFMQPARGPLLAKGRLIHRTATLAFTEGTVFDSGGRLCSQATGTFKYVRRLPPERRGAGRSG